MPSVSTSVLPFSPAELSYLHSSLSSIPPIRPDSRTSTDFRPLNAETGILPATNGSAHLSFSDGSEAIVGVKLEVEKSKALSHRADQSNGDQMDIDTAQDGRNAPRTAPHRFKRYIRFILGRQTCHQQQMALAHLH